MNETEEIKIKKEKLIRLLEKEREHQMKKLQESITEDILNDIEGEEIKVKDPEKGKQYSIPLTPIEYVILKNTTAPKLFRVVLKRAGLKPEEDLFIQVKGYSPAESGTMPTVEVIFKEKPKPDLPP